MKKFWLKFFPTYIREQIENSPNFEEVASNTGWLFADKILRLGVGLLVGVWIARYLGPEQFGIWSYALAFVALFGALASLGFERVVVRNIVRDPPGTNSILGSAFVLMLVGGGATLVIALVTISFVRSGEQLVFWLVGLSAAGYVFQAFNVIDFYFQSQVRAKYTVIAQNAAFLIFSIVQILLILKRAPLMAFAVTGLMQVITGSFFLVVAYSFNHRFLKDWRFDGAVARGLLKDSWPLAFSALAVMVYTRIDQIMIGQMLGDKQVGIYSAAVRISEAWYFIPAVAVVSVFPIILKIKQSDEKLYYLKLQSLFDVLAFLSLIAALVMTFASSSLVKILYSSEYSGSASVLALHIWTAISVSLGGASGSWFIAENLQRYAFYRTLSGALINVLFNFILIPKYGINGAAWATIIASFTTGYFFDATNLRTRRVFFMKTKSIFLINFLTKRQ